MESTRNEIAMLEWNRRLNEIKRKLHNQIPLENYGDDYYLRMLKISEVLIKAVQTAEPNLKNGVLGFWGTNCEYKLIGGTQVLNMYYNKDIGGSNSACITLEYLGINILQIVMFPDRDSGVEVLEGCSYTGENMIAIQDGEYSSTYPSGVLADALIESHQYLKTEKYSGFVVYGRRDEVLDLEFYKERVMEVLNVFQFQGIL